MTVSNVVGTANDAFILTCLFREHLITLVQNNWLTKYSIVRFLHHITRSSIYNNLPTADEVLLSSYCHTIPYLTFSYRIFNKVSRNTIHPHMNFRLWRLVFHRRSSTSIQVTQAVCATRKSESFVLQCMAEWSSNYDPST